MPRRSFKRRGTRRSYKKGKSSSKMMRAIAYHAIAEHEKSHTELKYQDNTYSFSPDYSGSTSFTFDLTSIGQGVTDILRIGDEIKLHNLKINFLVKGNTTANSYNFLRVVLFVWKIDTTLGGNPSLLNIFSNTLMGNVGAPFSQYLHDNRDDYTILWDKTFKVDSTLDNTTQSIVHIKKFKKLDKQKGIKYIGAGTNGIFKLYLGFFSDGLVQIPSIVGTTRITFTDS
nr:MAG: capsid protein [Cressdnaviricota sp.]